MALNEKQQFAFDKFLTGDNIFISGPGGVGKSYLIQHIMERFNKSTVLLAPTGIAALNIGGATIHSTFKFPTGILLKNQYNKVSDIAETLFCKDGPVKRIIIDEISMVRLDTFVAIDMNLRHARKSSKPFGGLQVIVFGDYYQLPPVLTTKEKSLYFENFDSVFAFNSKNWAQADFEFIELTQVMRQDDSEFIENLQRIRRRDTDLPKAIKFFNKLSSQNEDTIEDLDPVFLTTTNALADNINDDFFNDIDEEAKIFSAYKDRNTKIYPAPYNLELKYGCKVMFLANTEDYVNGEIGYVTGFLGNKIEVTKNNISEDVVYVNKYSWKEYEYKNINGVLQKHQIGSYTQYPLKLAWAVTIHKCQGLSLKSAVINLGNGSFASGQTYVALSRVKNLNGIYMTKKLKDKDVIVNPEIINFYENGAKGLSIF